MHPLARTAAAAIALAACATTAPALGAQVLAGTTNAYLAGITNADGAIASFESHTTALLSGTAISRDGRFAYLADSGNNVIRQYSRNPSTGVLTALAPASIAIPSPESPYDLALTPDGNWLLATTGDGGTTGRMRAYPVSAGGTLGAAASDVSTDVSIWRPAITPDGRHVYAANTVGANNWVYMWNLSPTGMLTAMSPARVDTGDLVGECVVMSVDGRTLYVPTGGANSGTGTEVVRWSINATTGVLTTTDTLPSHDGHVGACEGAVSSDGRVLAIGITGMYGGAFARVWPLGDDGVVGAQAPVLTMAAGSIAQGFALDPTGAFAYAASVSVFSSGTGALHQMRIAAAGASAIPSAAVGIPTTPWRSVSVAPAQPPVAALAPASGRPGQAVRLDASGSIDPDTQIVRYDWQFGDGTSASGAGPQVEHVYERAGEYTARVTVTNAAGCSTDAAGLYNGRMSSCIGGPTATATTAVRVSAVGASSESGGGGPQGNAAGATTRPKSLAGGFALNKGVGTTTGAVPAGATSIVQTARTGGSAATQGFLEMAKAKTAKGKCAITTVRNKKTKKVIKRTYRCTIKLSKGTWTVTTTARGTAGVVAQGTRRVVVK